MLDHVCLWAEPGRNPDGLWDKPQEIGAACVCLYDFSRDRFTLFGGNDLGQLRERAVMADWISGYDLLDFVYPLLWGQSWDDFRAGGYFRQLGPRTNDLLRRLQMAAGLNPDSDRQARGRWPLASLCVATLGRGPAGTNAWHYFQHDNWPAVASFALDGCAVVRDLVLFVERYGYLLDGGHGRLEMRHAGPRSPVADDNPAMRLAPQGLPGMAGDILKPEKS